MAVPVARVHLAMAHAALPALLPTPPKWKMMMPLLTTPPRVAILPKPAGRADSDERWDARKMKPASSLASSSSGKSGASSNNTCDTRKIGKTPSPKPGRADSVERWDAHKKKPANAAGTLPDMHSSNRASMSREALPAAHKNPLPPPPPPPHAKTSRCIGDDSSTGSDDDVEMDTAQSQLLRVLYAGPSFVAAPEPSMLPMPTFFIRAA